MDLCSSLYVYVDSAWSDGSLQVMVASYCIPLSTPWLDADSRTVLTNYSFFTFYKRKRRNNVKLLNCKNCFLAIFLLATFCRFISVIFFCKLTTGRVLNKCFLANYNLLLCMMKNVLC